MIRFLDFLDIGVLGLNNVQHSNVITLRQGTPVKDIPKCPLRPHIIIRKKQRKHAVAMIRETRRNDERLGSWNGMMR